MGGLSKAPGKIVVDLKVQKSIYNLFINYVYDQQYVTCFFLLCLLCTEKSNLDSMLFGVGYTYWPQKQQYHNQVQKWCAIGIYFLFSLGLCGLIY